MEYFYLKKKKLNLNLIKYPPVFRKERIGYKAVVLKLEHRNHLEGAC